MAKAGVSKEIRGHVLNHVAGAKTLKSTDVYNVHDYHQEKRDALSRLEDAVATIVQSSNHGHRDPPASTGGGGSCSRASAWWATTPARQWPG
jgi:hypothetical protein